MTIQKNLQHKEEIRGGKIRNLDRNSNLDRNEERSDMVVYYTIYRDLAFSRSVLGPKYL